MFTDFVKERLHATAGRHEEVAAACAVDTDWEKAVHHSTQAQNLVAAAERMRQDQRGSMVTQARHHERLATAHRSAADLAVALTHAQAAEDLRAAVEERPHRVLTIDDIRERFCPAPEPEEEGEQAAEEGQQALETKTDTNGAEAADEPRRGRSRAS
jgi:hypothetical protein